MVFFVNLHLMDISSLTNLKRDLECHPIFTRINSLSELRIFMSHHVYAVWDFMSLLKKLQLDLVPSGSPWLPNPNGLLVRFINEIVMEEESDVSFTQSNDTSYKSHFEIYLDSMREVNCPTIKLQRFLQLVSADGIDVALQSSDLPEPSRLFMQHTFETISQGKTHEIASSFAIARESVVPLMFKRILSQTDLTSSDVPVFKYYLERHAVLDGDHHGPMAHRLLDNLCDGDCLKEKEVISQAERSIQKRIEFWDGVLDALP